MITQVLRQSELTEVGYIIRTVERVARSILNIDLLLSYNGEDLREVIME